MFLTVGTALGFDVWKSFSPPNGGFSILMPSMPTESRLMQDTAMGKIFVSSFRLHMKNMAYIVSYNDYPEVYVGRSNINVFFAGVRDGSVGNINGRVLTQHNISISGYPGLEYVAEFMFKRHGDSTIKTRIYLVNNRLYQVSVIGMRGELSVAQQNKFLNSFKLL